MYLIHTSNSRAHQPYLSSTALNSVRLASSSCCAPLPNGADQGTLVTMQAHLSRQVNRLAEGSRRLGRRRVPVASVMWHLLASGFARQKS